MATSVDPAEVARYREMMRGGRTLPSVGSSETLPVQATASRKRNPKSMGRFQDINAFVDVTMAQLNRSELTTWLALFRFADGKTSVAQASVETIAARTGTSRQHTHKAIASLESKGLVERLRTGTVNSGASVYRIHALSTRR